MGDDVREALVLFLSANPQAGDLMPGTGGARKLCFRRPRTGERSGYRVIFYFAGRDVPVFLLNVFTKGDRANLSKAEQNMLRALLGSLGDDFREGSQS
jgi:hypothetical protein